MNRSPAHRSDRAFAALACLSLVLGPLAARGQERASPLWFQGTRLIFSHAVPLADDLAVPTRDPGMRHFLERLGATVSYDPQQRYVVVTSEDRRSIVFTLGDPTYAIGGVRARAPFAPRADGDDVDLPFFTLARALYVEPLVDGGETVLQPRIGALDVRTDGPHTSVSVTGAMPLVTDGQHDSPERLQLAFVGQGSALGPLRDALGPAVSTIDVAVGGTARVPTTTLTIAGTPGSTHRIVSGPAPDTLIIVFDAPSSGAVAVARTPPTPPPLPAEVGPIGSALTPPPSAEPGPTAAPPIVAGRATVTDLEIAPGADDALSVQVTLSGAVPYTWHRLPDHRWYVDLAEATLTGPGREEHPSFGAVQSVRVAQIGGDDAPAVRIAFTMSADQQVDLAPSASGLTITVSTAPATDLLRAGSGQTGGAPLVASSVMPGPEPTPSAPSGPGSRIIVIDPGHGGDDHGTEHNGLSEKAITLDIADRLRALLLAQGWNVRMTRETDVDPVTAANLARMRADGVANPTDRAYLQTRCDVANDVNARLFISIHVNSAPISSARGTTFYWYKPQDLPFAQALEKSVIPAAATQDDGTRHENFYVVRHTTMPAVLIETAFITNLEDVGLLRQPAFLQRLAQGIANGVKAYAGSPAANAVSQQQ